MLSALYRLLDRILEAIEGAKDRCSVRKRVGDTMPFATLMADLGLDG